jgi:hypothetical protein
MPFVNIAELGLLLAALVLPLILGMVAGDIPFLLIVAAVAAGLVWLGWFLTRRFAGGANPLLVGSRGRARPREAARTNMTSRGR